MKTHRCPLCRRSVLIVLAANRGSDLVLNAKPSPKGRVVLESAVNAAVKRGRFLYAGESYSGDRFDLHRYSCPKARDRRKPKVADDEQHELWSPVKEA